MRAGSLGFVSVLLLCPLGACQRAGQAAVSSSVPVAAQSGGAAGVLLPVAGAAGAAAGVLLPVAGAAGAARAAAGVLLPVAGAAGAARAAAGQGSSAAGSGGVTGGELAGRVGEAMSGSGGAAAMAPPSSGTLPAVSSLEKPGPFTPALVNATGPGGAYRLDYPKELGRDGVKHPVLVFVAGGGFPENYGTLLKYVASHGFVVLSYAANSDRGTEILDGLTWLGEQAAAASGMLSGKLDVQHAAAAGHSFGSLAVFNAASDPRLTTTIHLQGGTLDPHAEVANLRAPAAFICGESPSGDQDGTWTGDMANPNCAIDFDKAKVPVFYGSLQGAAHIQLTDAVEDPADPLRLRMLGAIGGWLRWRLAGDETQRARYAGPDCELCKPGTGWKVAQKGL